MNLSISILFIVILIGLIYLIYIIYRLPKYKLNTKYKTRIKECGLMHFTFASNVSKILENGLEPNNKKALDCFEHNMVWMYIAESDKFIEKLNIIRSKGKRKGCVHIAKSNGRICGANRTRSEASGHL